MTYNKPEITNLGDAASVIHGQDKPVVGITDPAPPSNPDFLPAYDLDE